MTGIYSKRHNNLLVPVFIKAIIYRSFCRCEMKIPMS